MHHRSQFLISRTNGDGVKESDVMNPLYCYEGGKVSMKNLMSVEDDPINVERAAIIVSRGWIPAFLRDKRSRHPTTKQNWQQQKTPKPKKTR